jgi:hypothetical protein
MPDLLISRGGIKAVGVSFDKMAAAQDFLAKAKASKDITKAAQAAQLSKNVQDFKMVNDQSVGIDSALRDKILEIKKVPAVELIKLSDNKIWVVSATEKEEAKYRPFEQIKSGLEQLVKREKSNEVFEQELNKLKKNIKLLLTKSTSPKRQMKTNQAQKLQQWVKLIRQ